MSTAAPRFTTRPELAGTFGMVASTHWIASAVAMAVLEKGGNAFDAAVAGGFVLQVVEPHLNGPGGDLTLLLYGAAEGRVRALCGQGTAPAAATIAACRALGLDLIPGDGLLAATVPGAFDAWLLLLRNYGTMRLGELLAPAIAYAEAGHPILAQAAATIAGRADFFRAEWPGSAALWLPGGAVPEPGALVANPALAATWRRLLAEAERRDREDEIEAARRVFREGFVAEAIDRFCRTAEVADATGRRHTAFLRGSDLAGWRAAFEEPLALDHGDARIFKLGLWSQGPVLLQALAALDGLGLDAMEPAGPDFVHVVTEALKLALADREAYYGDRPDAAAVAAALLAADYTAGRRAAIGPEASLAFRPGALAGHEAEARLAHAIAAKATEAAAGSSEPTFGRLAEEKGRGDTCHIDVADRFGNLVSATPSGGWLQSSPTIPELGFCLGSRAQMFRLEEGSPSALIPGRRPRCTLSPTIAFRRGEPWLACGTPGGDQQDQWQLIFLSRLLHHGMNLQEAIDGPLFFSEHAPLSFWPRGAQPGRLRAEASFSEATLAGLAARGHRLAVEPAWSIGRLCAVAREGGLLKGAATPRLMQAYAIGR
jgi:gamma-glutamyltranspeptidase/glutathione hydrolase